jgi:predicted Zn-dependent peptidase
MYEDQPWERAYSNMLSALFHSHPIRRRICGSVASIGKITPALLRRAYDAYYRLSNMALIVCGDVTPQQVNAVCDKMLTEEAPVVKIERVFPEEPEEINTPYAEDFFEISVKGAK